MVEKWRGNLGQRHRRRAGNIQGQEVGPGGPLSQLSCGWKAGLALGVAVGCGWRRGLPELGSRCLDFSAGTCSAVRLFSKQDQEGPHFHVV